MDPRTLIDLNRPPAGHPEQWDHGCKSGPIEVVFRNYKSRLLQLYEEARTDGLVSLGAVAWLTDFEILDAMTKVPTSVVVQKEDFLRPDEAIGSGRDRWRDILREHYLAVEGSDIHQPEFCRQHFPHPLGDMNLTGDQTISGIRCFGVRNERRVGGRGPRPLMHNKFILFAKLSFSPAPGHEGEDDPLLAPTWDPRIVWTGSCNLTRLTPRSRENALIIRDAIIGEGYLREWVEIMAMSEPLDWDSQWVDPEWRLGS